ncbi:MAG TPA: sigma-70 family RNA polymerase sigma factor [Saprospiraceae bacterium]|nr:sigma-70 family RNA polymerase sigma factor [Saprospiraceae bacterium]HPI07045.1 sigma-70 family RNA polymerase sigma factor [Saprospiraceae bacterium]
MAATLSDEILIEQARNGRQTAFAMLVKRYEQYAFTLALRFVKNREDAHEVAQDAFLRAFRYLPDFRGDAKFTTWLYKIVYSTSLNFLRKQNPDIQSIDDDDRPVKLPDEGTPDPSQAMERDDRNAALQRAIQMLSPDDAGIITLFYLYEHSLEEICQIMDMTMTNAKTKLCRARQRLKGIVEGRFSTEIAY